MRVHWVAISVGLLLPMMALPPTGIAADAWFATTDPNDSTPTLYRSPEEACFRGVMFAYIGYDRPNAPPTAQYRILSSSVQLEAEQDYICQGVVERRADILGDWNAVIYAGDALHLGMPDRSNPKCNSSCCELGGCGSNGSNPVQTSTGNKHQVEPDFIGAGVFPLKFTRTYDGNRSVERAMTPLGAGWTHSYGAYVVGIGPRPFTQAVAYRPDGRILGFQAVNGVWHGDPDVPERLTYTENGDGNGMPQWKLTTIDDEVEVYDGLGLLQSITNRDGLTQVANYTDPSGHNSGYVQSVRDPSGRTLAFTYNGSDQIVGLTDGNAKTISYGYTSGNLTSATYPGDGGATAVRTYLYNESGQTGGTSQPYSLTGIVNENSQRFASWGYDSLGRAILSVHGPYVTGTIDRTAFQFNGDGTVRVTDGLGQPRTFAFQTLYQVARYTALDTPCDYCGTNFTSRGYDSNGYPSTGTDFRGFQTTSEYAATDGNGHPRGLETQRVEAVGQAQQRTTNTTWSPTFRVPIRRTVSNRFRTTESRTDWAYNSRGQPLARCAYDLSVAGAGSYVCSASGSPPNGIRRWTYTYCDAIDGTDCPLIGLQRTVDGPRTDVSDVTAYSYRMTDDTANPPKYRKGDLWKLTNASGQVTEYAERDGNGRPTKVIDPNGVTTEMTYHPRGWLETRSVKGVSGSPDATTIIAYDNVGNVTQVTQPDGAYLAYTYDIAHRLTRITDNLGNIVDYCPGGTGTATCLDALGNRQIDATYAAGGGTATRLVTRAFNSLDRLTDQYDAQNRATHYDYDGNANRVLQTDPDSVQTQQVYDPLNRLQMMVQDYQGTDGGTANASTKYTYDTRDNVTRITDPSTLLTTYTFDKVDNLDKLISPDTGTTTYTQDAAGNRTSQTDANGTTSTYFYDALNRLTRVRFGPPIGGSPSNRYYYDQPNSTTGCTTSYPIGRLTSMTDPTGSTTYCYDHRGNVIRKSQVTGGVTYAVSYAYNLADRLMSIDYPDGARVEYTRDALGRITAVKVRPTTGGTLTNVVATITYRPFGPAATYSFASGGQALVLGYDQNDWLTDVTGTVLNLHFCRDAEANITRLRTATPACSGTPLEQYDYDALYRLQQVQDGAGSLIEGYSYNPTGDRLGKTIGGTTANYVYEAGSHRLGKVGNELRDYDANGNLVHGSVDGRSFTFDQRNRLTQFAVSGTTLTFDYNARGERVVKGDLGAPDTSAHFVYDEAGRLLTDAGNGNPNPTDYVYVDARPVALVRNGALYYVHSDQLGTPRAVTAAGSATPVWSWSFTGNPFGEATPTGSLTVNLRFPGQYYDAKENLAYNYYRDYEAGTGRYIESDPVGLRGGLSTYAYALNSPSKWKDRLGGTPEDAAEAYCGSEVGCLPVPTWPDWGKPSCSYYDDQCKQCPHDMYACSAGTCCRSFSSAPATNCTRRCLIVSDARCTGLDPAARSRCRVQNHVVCYSSCQNISDLVNLPWTKPECQKALSSL